MIENIPGIPRIYTALSEWLACLIIILPFLRGRWTLLKAFTLVGTLVIQILFQLGAGMLPIILWIPGMIVNVLWMYITLKYFTRQSFKATIFLCSKAFILAEFSAAICWQLFYQFSLGQDVEKDSAFPYMIIGLVIIFFIFLIVELRTNQQEVPIQLRNKETLMAILTALIIFILSNSGYWLSDTRVFFGNAVGIFSVRSFVNLSGICLLYLQETQRKEDYLKKELLSINNVFQTQYQQYVAYKENSDIVNRMCHDLKHQIDVIRAEDDPVRREHYLEEMEKEIIDFESPVETGHPVLDTILTRKNQFCLEHGIKLSCFVDGQLLSFMNVMDICSLFGNALDNAIESVQELPNKEQRLIHLRVDEKNGFVIIKLNNYSVNQIDIEDGLPETTKKDKMRHGYGLKSISQTVAVYDGTMTISTKENWFILKILLPNKIFR
ncbi:hypothetical protein A5821_001682 [Enterococcus sp. 7F3_DIV0205]|uniref:Sensor histidine kinase NatK-like C-terminal domain-containing protein n=1 Tax=Candidatus Enterococcus palustris TaxID=1834189 RepID=A0AAQ3W8E5_9ENTE|nr:ATP-binding protein [Enterococcus sp. 7F3_DIV0205]OTN86077.1 hypothetical protein A5821_002027 [Enterococcus sp. 7F3_DIV0205]